MGAEDRLRAGLLKTGQVAKLLGLSRYQVLRLIEKGEIPAERLGHNFFMKRSDLEAQGLVPPQIDTDAIYRAWMARTNVAISLIHEAIAGVDVPVARLAVAEGIVEGSTRWGAEYDRDLAEALRMVLTTPGAGMQMLLTSYADCMRQEVARGFARRSGREVAQAADYAAADFFLPFMMEWAAAMWRCDFRRRHVDVNREIATGWGLEPLLIFSARSCWRHSVHDPLPAGEEKRAKRAGDLAGVSESA